MPNELLSRRPIDNSGQLRIASGELELAGVPFTQTGGITELAGGRIRSNSIFTIQSGELRGSGTVTADVTNVEGSVVPGTSPGILAVNGSYTQQAGGTLAVEITGPPVNESGNDSAGTSYDRLRVTGTANLNGQLDVSVTDDYALRLGDTYAVLAAGRHAVRSEVPRPEW